MEADKIFEGLFAKTFDMGAKVLNHGIVRFGGVFKEGINTTIPTLRAWGLKAGRKTHSGKALVNRRGDGLPSPYVG